MPFEKGVSSHIPLKLRETRGLQGFRDITNPHEPQFNKTRILDLEFWILDFGLGILDQNSIKSRILDLERPTTIFWTLISKY
jgi:hypothetical protein